MLWPQPDDERIEPLKDDPAFKTGAIHHLCGYHLTDDYKPPSLLAVSRQVRLESSKMFYSNTLFFRFGYDRHTQKALTSWLASLVTVARDLVKSFKGEEDGGFDRLRDPAEAVVDLMVDRVHNFRFQNLLEVPVKDSGARAGLG